MKTNIGIGFIALASLAACATDEEITEDAIDEEETSTIESTLCTDGVANAYVTFDEFGGESAATSALPTNSYDHPDCSDRFAVEVTGVGSATEPFDVLAGWGEALPATQQSCINALAVVQTSHYHLKSFNCSGQFCAPVYGWTQVGGDIVMQGQWKPTFGGYHCVLVPESPLPTFQPSAFRSKVRVSVKAAAFALVPFYKKGKAGVYSQPIIY